jgi:hypothetical protein
MGATRDVIEDLRRQIERLHGGLPSRKSLPFGIAPIDRHLPTKGLALGALHEVIEHGRPPNLPEQPPCSQAAFSPASKVRFCGV